MLTVPKSVHCTATVTSDVGENLWETDYFSIVLPVYLQTTMGRGTKDVSPLTAERAQKTKIPNFQIFLPHILGAIKAREIFQQKGGN